ncbi:ATP-binding protein [Kribbella swartbergensis]
MALVAPLCEGCRALQGRTSRQTIEVADDGPGFPPTVLDSAFQRFVRGDPARTPGTSGAGLGLAIVRAIITAHGGTVEARDDGPLGGAAVTATLPLNRPTG